jgi:hypothetical protein
MTTPEQATVNKRQKEWATHAQFAADAVAQWPKWKQAFAVQFLCQLGCDDANRVAIEKFANLIHHTSPGETGPGFSFTIFTKALK